MPAKAVKDAMRMPISLIAVLMTIAVGRIDAGPITYTFVGTGAAFSTTTQTFPAEPVAFRLTFPTFVNPPLDGPATSISCAQLDSNTNCLGEVFFSNQSVLGAFQAQLQFDASNNVTYLFFFPTGAFGSPGVYRSGGTNINIGTLTVTDTPEAGSPVLVESGLFLIGALVLRRLYS